MKLGIVDVRDTADAHLNAIKVPEAANRRFLLASETAWFGDIAATLHKEFSPHGYPVCHGDASYCIIRTISCFNSDFKMYVQNWDYDFEIDTTPSKEILKISYRPSTLYLNEMGWAMIDAGVIEDKREGAVKK